MTQNQLSYMNLRETQRANLAKEEQARNELAQTKAYQQRSGDIQTFANLETQRANLAREAETSRLNTANIEHNASVLAETKRANQVKETETLRSNLARESETSRSNRASESEAHRSNVARENETRRSNLAHESETYRTNLANEIIKANTLEQRFMEEERNFGLALEQLANAIRSNDLREREIAVKEAAQALAETESLSKIFSEGGKGFSSFASGLNTLLKAIGALIE